ncbi:MAG: DUF4124 domain-containing protein [Archangium sp.]|nr:DUF4124 domain-containing protein [Archangium sp.]
MLAFWLAASVVVTQSVYRWTDAEGEEHYTNEPGSIPKGAKDVQTVTGDLDIIEGDAPAESASKPKVELDSSDEVRAPRTVASSAERDERFWRGEFRTARSKVKELEDEIETDRKQVEEVNGLPVIARSTCGNGWGGVPGGVVVNNGANVVGAVQVAPGVTISGSAGSTVVQQQSWPGYVGAPCWLTPNPMFEQSRHRLEMNRRRLVRAKEELADLERRASFDAVPLEWRR